jgi:hypothetical protein
VSGQLHDPVALPPGKDPAGTHWVGSWVGPRASLDDMEKRKFLTFPGTRTPTPRSSRYTDCAIPAPVRTHNKIHFLRCIFVSSTLKLQVGRPPQLLVHYVVTPPSCLDTVSSLRSLPHRHIRSFSCKVVNFVNFPTVGPDFTFACKCLGVQSEVFSVRVSSYNFIHIYCLLHVCHSRQITLASAVASYV